MKVQCFTADKEENLTHSTISCMNTQSISAVSYIRILYKYLVIFYLYISNGENKSKLSKTYCVKFERGESNFLQGNEAMAITQRSLLGKPCWWITMKRKLDWRCHSRAQRRYGWPCGGWAHFVSEFARWRAASTWPRHLEQINMPESIQGRR